MCVTDLFVFSNRASLGKLDQEDKEVQRSVPFPLTSFDSFLNSDNTFVCITQHKFNFVVLFLGSSWCSRSQRPDRKIWSKGEDTCPTKQHPVYSSAELYTRLMRCCLCQMYFVLPVVLMCVSGHSRKRWSSRPARRESKSIKQQLSRPFCVSARSIVNLKLK